jgi:hypothetical protein
MRRVVLLLLVLEFSPLQKLKKELVMKAFTGLTLIIISVLLPSQLSPSQLLRLGPPKCSVPDKTIAASWNNATGTCVWTLSKFVFGATECSDDNRCLVELNPNGTKDLTCATPEITVPDTCNQLTDKSDPPEFTTSTSRIVSACEEPIPICPYGTSWNNESCSCEQFPRSPILIDLDGTGFQLTAASNGVLFDLSGTGTVEHTAWTAPAVRNGFLALDRNGNGQIDNGTELFGDATPQPSSSHPNGFVALAEFDKRTNGGNEDGVIDKQDAIYSHLLIWVDVNHDGISQSDELMSLSAVGINSIDLAYKVSRRRDSYGNLFRYKARVNSSQPLEDIGPWAYDVLFVTNR